MVTALEIFKKGAELANEDPDTASMMVDFDGDKVCFRFTDDKPITMVTSKGKVVIEEGERPDSQVVMELSAIKICDVIDKTMDIMELNKAGKMVKGQLQDIFDHVISFMPYFNAMQKFYPTNHEFKKMVDERKAKK
jgi:hypothetical protein